MADTKSPNGNLYGSGPGDRINPLFPNETSYTQGSKKLTSPHGSIFNLPIDSTNALDRRLKNVGPKG